MAATAAPASKLAAPAPKSSEVGFCQARYCSRNLSFNKRTPPLRGGILKPAHVRSSRRQPQSSPRGKCQCRILRPQLTSFEVTPPQCRRSPRCRCDIVAVEVRRSGRHTETHTVRTLHHPACNAILDGSAAATMTAEEAAARSMNQSGATLQSIADPATRNILSCRSRTVIRPQLTLSVSAL